MSLPTYIVLDTETTGLLPQVHGIIEIAASVLDENLEVLETIQYYVNPPLGRIIEQYALDINHISTETIEQGISYEKACETFTAFVRKHFTETPTFIGQFYPFDFAMMVDMYVTCSRNEDCMWIFKNKFLDTKVIANYLNIKAQKESKPLPFPITTSLSNTGGLKDTLGVSGHEAHTALGDVLATGEVLQKLLEI
jgi:DNA polymerase III epsilon subunit-like protein